MVRGNFTFKKTGLWEFLFMIKLMGKAPTPIAKKKNKFQEFGRIMSFKMKYD